VTNRLGRKLGEGAGSEVFAWEGEDKIVKLAKPNTSIAALRRELNNSRTAWACGLPVPEPFELITIGDRYGIVFERVYGESVLKQLVSDVIERQRFDASGDPFEARLTACLLHQVHSHAAPDLRCQREQIVEDIRRAPYLTDSEKATLIADLTRLPEKQCLCHGDPNPGNILIRERDAILIDWNDATTGNPEADLAEYVLLLRFAAMPSYLNFSPTSSSDLQILREEAIRIFVEEYEKLSGIGYEKIDPWIAPLAARKLTADAFSEEEKALLVAEIRRKIRYT
jgi:uncharacterized protein (TIGR02172 family)